jgi:hypothetical protein
MATKLAYDEKVASPTKPTSEEQGFSGSNLISNGEKQDRKQSAPEYTCIKRKRSPCYFTVKLLAK